MQRLAAALLTAALAVSVPGQGVAQQKPTASRGFGLMARSLAGLTINRVRCGFNSVGETCIDTVIDGFDGQGIWPSETYNRHLWASGLQAAALIGADGGPWAGDTTGAFFFDPKGTTVHGAELEPIWRSTDADDSANWPTAGLVPPGRGVHASLVGGATLGDADLWWVTWEGDLALNAGRPHPLGVVVESRAVGFTYPAGADDQIYLLYTVYNASSTAAATYASAPTGMQSILLEAGQRLHASAAERLGADLPPGGWTLLDFYFGFSSDPDVADAGNNFASVSLPLGSSLAWTNAFDGEYARSQLGWRFPSTAFGPPFFGGPGFTGVTSLGQSATPEVTLYTNTAGGGEFGAPGNAPQLWRYLSGKLSTAVGDPACSHDPTLDRICYVNLDDAGDSRHVQSWGGVDLAPGESRSYLAVVNFAAPVAVSGFTGAPNADIKPGDPRRWSDPAQLVLGANQVDSIAGFAGWVDDNGNGQVDGLEVRTVPGSLYWKAQVAQVLFGAGFLRAQPPVAPEFFLVPGDGAVTVLWRPSLTEEMGDPYWQVAGSPRTAEGFPNPLYDANYRRNDVEGYRIWRGRTDKPGALELVAQFDYDNTTFHDHYGIVNPNERCAPELGVTVECPVSFEPPVPGEPLTVSVEHGIAQYGGHIQVTSGGGHTPRALFPDGTAYTFEADTVRTPVPLWDTGVPFLFRDTAVRNGLRYFYAVTAFDVNSIRSGPSSLESVPGLQGVVPERPAVNYTASVAVSGVEMLGRGRVLVAEAPPSPGSAPGWPTIDPETGTFSGPMPPSKGWDVRLDGLMPELLAGDGTVTLQLDSLTLGSSYATLPTTYWWRHVETGVVLPLTLQQSPTSSQASAQAPFAAVPLDADLAARYGGAAGYALQGHLSQQMAGTYFAGGYGRGCYNGGQGFSLAGSRNCAYNGSRWFAGPSPAQQEVTPHPIAGNTPNFNGTAQDPNVTNAGYLPGVVTIFQAQGYQSASSAYRQVEGVLSAVRRSADYNVYWGVGGTIDSVTDATHNTALPFAADHLADTWGILNADAAQPSGPGVSYDQRAELTTTDFACVEPLRNDPSAAEHMPCGTGPGTGPTYLLSRTAVPGPVAVFSGGNTANARTGPTWPQAGFGLYLAGNIHLFQLVGGQVPSAGAVWTLRDYVGAIAGGGCATCGAGDYGDYIFTPYPVQPLTATGVELRLSYEVTNAVLATTNADLRAVHTVPDPYYLGSVAEPTGGEPELRFVNLPDLAIVRIYSLSGRLVRVLEHHGAVPTDAVTWDLTNRRGEQVAPGVYFWHVESGEARRIGRFTILDYRGGPL